MHKSVFDAMRTQAVLGLMLLLGLCGGSANAEPASVNASMDKLRSAAERGDADTQYRMDLFYKFGDYGLPKDQVLATRWNQKAAEQGRAEAEVILGHALSDGAGIKKNETEAVNWYRKAALQGNAIGQAYWAGMLYTGCGVKQNYSESVAWYRKAADQGEVQSEVILGSALEQGIGVAGDVREAAEWYRKAASSGSETAETRLKQLEQRN